ncbi:hypothetical protein BDY17DRAFT_227470, partial [Neohortaea acidophila]
PVEHVESGITPVADFIPKETASTSHPTPPPDEPLVTGSADIDVTMANVSSEPEPASAPVPLPLPAQAEQSLVRPREDDDDDEPAAKRSRVTDEPITEPARPDSTLPVRTADIDADIAMDAAPANETSSAPTPAQTDAPAVEQVTATIAEPSFEPPSAPIADVAAAPVLSSSEAPVKDEVAPAEELPSGPLVEPSADTVPAAPSVPETPVAATPAEMAPPAVAQPATTEPLRPVYSTEPMTAVQKAYLLDKTKNLKKTKHSFSFLRAVDPVALNIPTYPDIIKNPMDLGTLENKLKDDKYGSVQAFVDDFDLIISNSRRFNGDHHVVTQAGFAMEAYFKRVMESVPGPNELAPVKQKSRSPSIATEKPRREPRAATLPAPPPAAAAATTPAEAFALQPDGTPQIRRQSSMSNRPARTIKPPQNREIAYSKPKRKEHQLELRFCEHVLEELRSPKYAGSNQVFLWPVDPVALNIPNYRQIVKTPMDLSTMSQKLKGGLYATAEEFRKDFDLMIKNCLTFNPIGNPVHDLGVQFQRHFEELWHDKEKWERKNQPASNRASSASADDESGAEDEEEEEDEGPADQSATIRALQKQLAEMQNALSGFVGEKPKTKKPKSAKTGGGKKQQGGSGSSAPGKKSSKAAAKPKKQRVVTYEEKQEISEAVNKMNEGQISTLTSIITENCEKYRNMDDMELEIDDLPNYVQALLLDYVRKLFPKKKAREASPDDAAALDDDDYEERGGGRGGKRKKHRPMGKKEQQDTINNIKNKLAQFSQPGFSGSESPTNSSFNAANAQVDTSGDEESEESEEE